MQAEEEQVNNEQHEHAKILVTWYAEMSLKSVLDQITGIHQSVSQYCRFMLDESNSREQVSQLRTLTERQAKHWAEGVRVAIERIEFEGVELDADLKAGAMKLVEQCEQMKLE